jgi:hypothetical protein
LGRTLTLDPSAISRLEGPSLVRSFLAIVLSQRLAFDLGEPLEAAATGWPAYQKGFARLEEELAAIELPDNPPEAGQWRGLAGWLFVTRALESTLRRYEDARASS